MEKVSLKVREKFVEPPAKEKKDDTVDVIGWKPFIDGRSSQLVIIAQCSSGWNWEGKLISLRYERWCQYIHWTSKPLKGFSVPRVIPDRKWHESGVDAGLLLDRVRIYNLLVNTQSTKFRKELIKWCNNQIANLTN